MKTEQIEARHVRPGDTIYSTWWEPVKSVSRGPMDDNSIVVWTGSARPDKGCLVFRASDRVTIVART